ncbi:MAG: dephospho-CoA kinase [Agarilytica sp.]
MRCIGLTGGISSGKTTVSDAFKALGITIVDTDVIARDIVKPGSHCLKEIEKRYGKTILDQDGTLDRKRLRDIIFQDDSEKRWLESLMHPVIRQQTEQQVQSATSPYVILSSPLLIESPDIHLVDRVLVVDVPEAAQVSRTLLRDGVDESQIQRTIAAQLSRQERLDRADDIIDNSHEKSHTLEQVKRLHETYLTLSK